MICTLIYFVTKQRVWNVFLRKAKRLAMVVITTRRKHKAVTTRCGRQTKSRTTQYIPLSSGWIINDKIYSHLFERIPSATASCWLLWRHRVNRAEMQALANASNITIAILSSYYREPVRTSAILSANLSGLKV